MNKIDRSPKMDKTDTGTHQFLYASPVTDPEKLRIYKKEIDEIFVEYSEVGVSENGQGMFYTCVFFTYRKFHFRDALPLIHETRCGRGALVRNPFKEVWPINTYDKNDLDCILENALQRKDFRAIRVILSHEGYGTPLNEPNDLVIPAEWDNERSRDSEKIKIEVTPEEYDILMGPLDTGPPPEPTLEELAIHKTFAEAMAESIPLRLERLIRRRDAEALRMMLRLYGHRLLPDEPSPAEHIPGNLPKPL